MSDMTVRAVLTADSKSWVSGFQQAENAAKKTATVAKASSTAAQTAAAKQSAGMSAIGTGAMVAGAALLAFSVTSVKAFNDAAMSAVKLQRVMGGSVEGALKAAQKSFLDEKERERRKNIKAVVDYQRTSVDPFGGGARPGTQAVEQKRGGSSDAQIALLVNLGVEYATAAGYSRKAWPLGTPPARRHTFMVWPEIWPRSISAKPA